MNKLHKNVDGFSTVELIVILIVLILVIFVGWLVNNNHNKGTINTSNVNDTNYVSNVSTGTYYDSASQDVPHYILIVNSDGSGKISGSLVYDSLSGNNSKTFNYTASTSSDTFTLNTNPSTKGIVSVAANGVELTLNNCQKYLKNINGVASCIFTMNPSGSGYDTAKQQWESAAKEPSSSQNAQFNQAITDLSNSIKTDKNTSGYKTAIADLKQLTQIPEPSATPFQDNEAINDINELNIFFNTPGLF